MIVKNLDALYRIKVVILFCFYSSLIGMGSPRSCSSLNILSDLTLAVLDNPVHPQRDIHKCPKLSKFWEHFDKIKEQKSILYVPIKSLYEGPLDDAQWYLPIIGIGMHRNAQLEDVLGPYFDITFIQRFAIKKFNENRTWHEKNSLLFATSVGMLCFFIGWFFRLLYENCREQQQNVL